MRALVLLLLAVSAASAQDHFGAKGIFPVYETADQWLVFDKRPKVPKGDKKLAVGSKLLVVGSQGAEVFDIARTSGTYGALCRKGKPVKLRAALLKGPRRIVGRPIIGIAVPPSFSLKGSKAVYKALKNETTEATYQKLLEPLKNKVIAEVEQGGYKFKLDDAAAEPFLHAPKPEKIQIKIDFGATVQLKGIQDAFAFVEETQISASSRRCVRLAAGDALIGGCEEMPRQLMAETDLLQFVSYDPTGRGTPLLLAFTKTTPMWGDERWGYVLRGGGPSLFLKDALDTRCREAF